MIDESVNDIAESVKNDLIGKPGHLSIIEDLAEAIKEDREPIVTGLDGRKALELDFI